MSSSRTAGTERLDACEDYLREFLGPNPRAARYVPFAGVAMGPDEYSALVAERLGRMGVPCTSLHREADPGAAIGRADAVVVGGGNTFRLLAALQRTGLPCVGLARRGSAPLRVFRAGGTPVEIDPGDVTRVLTG